MWKRRSLFYPLIIYYCTENCLPKPFQFENGLIVRIIYVRSTIFYYFIFAYYDRYDTVFYSSIICSVQTFVQRLLARSRPKFKSLSYFKNEKNIIRPFNFYKNENYFSINLNLFQSNNDYFLQAILV